MSDMALPLPAALPLSDAARPQPRLRLGPGVVIVVLEWLGLTVPGRLDLNPFVQFMCMMFSPMVATAALAIWWLFASRLRWPDRLLLLLAWVAAGAGMYFAADKSYSFMCVILYAVPVATTAWVGWLLVTPWLSWPARRWGLVVVMFLAWGHGTLLRWDGITGDFKAEFSWRWSQTAEQRFLAEHAAATPEGTLASAVPVAESVVLQPGDWPGFRGAQRDGRLTGVQIPVNWKERPPRLVWRHRVGPAWSSFAVVGRRLYTQEQWDKDEAVVCYDADTGKELWAHRDAARFTEAVSGAGPRATPTFHDGKIYALGGNGRLNCLDAVTGRPVWSRDVVADSGAKVPMWGFASSPLIAQGIVSVFAGGPDGKSVQGYHAATGEPAWSAGDGLLSYCSTQPARLGGVDQLLIVTEAGMQAFDPTRGTVLWRHDWPVKELARILQPALVSDSDVLIGTGMKHGTRRVHVQRKDGGWSDAERWTSKAFSPYFNDLVLYKDHLYGFDGIFLVCVGLEDGKLKWKARGYANGQALLLADQGVLLILTETGEAALVQASPDAHQELGRFPALEGKTWNHPVVAHGKLFVRNGEEAACYQLVDADAAGNGRP